MVPSNSSEIFSMNRFQLVSKRFFVLNRKNWLIGFLGAAGLLLSFWLLPVLLTGTSGNQLHFNSIEGAALFFYSLGGLVLTSRIFNELHSSDQAFRFLTLPSTTFEKLLSAWFVSSVAFTVVAIAGIFLLSVIIEFLSALYFGYWGNFHLFNPFRQDALQTITGYFFYHSIFLLGAVYFKKNNFLKTLLVIITFFIGMFFMLSIGGFILALMLAEDFSFRVELLENAFLYQSILKWAGGIFLTLLFLFFSYLQLKNKQVA